MNIILSDCDPRLAKNLSAAINEVYTDRIVHRIGHVSQLFEILESADKSGTVVVNLNMTLTSAKECLLELKKNRNWASVPVIILSRSVKTADYRYCMLHGASYYLASPSTSAELQCLTSILLKSSSPLNFSPGVVSH